MLLSIPSYKHALLIFNIFEFERGDEFIDFTMTCVYFVFVVYTISIQKEKILRFSSSVSLLVGKLIPVSSREHQKKKIK